MRPTHSIEEILGTRSRVAVLRVLWNARSPLNTSQIASRARLTHPAATSAIELFADAGIVRSSSAGRANVHLIERSNVYVQSYVEPLFAAELALPELLMQELKSTFVNRAQSAVLFGSYARSAQDTTSDVDIALVADDAQSKAALDDMLHAYGAQFRERWGASLSPVTYEVREANALWRTAPAFWKSLNEDGVVILGRGPWEWTDDE